MRKLERAGVRVAVSTLDVVDAGQAARLLALAAEHAPVAGVFHLAMYLDDRLLASQVQTLGVKVRVACASGRHVPPGHAHGWPPAGQPVQNCSFYTDFLAHHLLKHTGPRPAGKGRLCHRQRSLLALHITAWILRI